MKTQYLLDECVTIHFPHYATKSKKEGYVESVQKVKQSARDWDVFEFAKKKKLTVVTSDKKFTLNMLLDNHTVIYLQQHGDQVIIESKLKEIDNANEKYMDPVTYYLHSTDSVIYP